MDKPIIETNHHWSGWPGAYCLHCGAEDPLEMALAQNDFDPQTGTWLSGQAPEWFIKGQKCFTVQEALDACPQCQARKNPDRWKDLSPEALLKNSAADETDETQELENYF